MIVWRSVREVQRQELLGAGLMGVHGTLQREGAVRKLIAGHLEDLTPRLGEVGRECGEWGLEIKAGALA